MVPRSDTELICNIVFPLLIFLPGNVTQQDRAYGIELKHASVEDHGTWTVSITSNPTNPADAQVNSTQFEVIVAKAPREVVFEGSDYQVSFFFIFSCLKHFLVRETMWYLRQDLDRMRSPPWTFNARLWSVRPHQPSCG